MMLPMKFQTLTRYRYVDGFVRANGLQQLDPLPARQSVDACCGESSAEVTVRL